MRTDGRPGMGPGIGPGMGPGRLPCVPQAPHAAPQAPAPLPSAAHGGRPAPDAGIRRRALGWLAAAPGLSVLAGLAGCVNLGLGDGAGAHRHLVLHDPAAPPAPRDAPLVPALLIRPQGLAAPADMLAIAYALRPHELAYYQLASWTERPVRRVPRLLQQRLQARGVARSVGLLGDPLEADWLLGVAVDELHHDLREPPGQGRIVLTLDLFDRSVRRRVAQRRIEALAPAPAADAAGSAAALSQALGRAFDTLVPWLEAELQRAAAGA